MTILKTILLSIACAAALGTAHAQQADDGTSLTLPSGRVLHFASADARAKFMASQQRAQVNASEAQRKEQQQRTEREQKQREEDRVKTMLAEHATRVYATVTKFTDYGVVVAMDFAFTTPDGTTKDIGRANGLAYLQASEVRAVSGETVLLTIYECGKARIGGEVYRLCTTDSAKALQYYTDPKSAQWDGLHDIADVYAPSK